LLIGDDILTRLSRPSFAPSFKYRHLLWVPSLRYGHLLSLRPYHLPPSCALPLPSQLTPRNSPIQAKLAYHHTHFITVSSDFHLIRNKVPDGMAVAPEVSVRLAWEKWLQSNSRVPSVVVAIQGGRQTFDYVVQVIEDGLQKATPSLPHHPSSHTSHI
jgi:hypothetical protein